MYLHFAYKDIRDKSKTFYKSDGLDPSGEKVNTRRKLKIALLGLLSNKRLIILLLLLALYAANLAYAPDDGSGGGGSGGGNPGDGNDPNPLGFNQGVN